MRLADRVGVKIHGQEFDGVVIGYLPCGDIVVSIDGKSVAVPPKDLVRKEVMKMENPIPAGVSAGIFAGEKCSCGAVHDLGQNCPRCGR